MSSPTRRRHRMHVEGHRQDYDSIRNSRILDISLFSPQSLDTEEGVLSALINLDKFWWLDDLVPFEIPLRELMAHHNLFAYVVAIALDDARYEQLLSTLQRTFPSTASTFVSSLASDLVNHLREFFVRFPSHDVPRSLDKCHRAVGLKLNALRALNELKFDVDPPPENIPQESPGGTRFKQSQWKKKHEKQQSRSSFTADCAPFKAIGVDTPRTMEEAADCARDILEEIKTILEEYLRVLRLPELTSAIRQLYIWSQLPSPVQPAAPGTLTGTMEISGIAPNPITQFDAYPAYPQIQPLKAAKYFSEPAEGFGSWQLLLSTRAIQHLKVFRRDESTQWAIIKKKMQELSNGFFSESNQKKLSGSTRGVPIFEAKLSRDLRIIYQIDLAPDDTPGHDHQVIKIWGIHTHAQMDQRLWKSISYHQSRIGGEYRRRCLYRNTSKYLGDSVIIPASWPSAVDKLPTDDFPEDCNMAMTPEEQLELHSILALEKFTRMSQALMNSIVADQDDTYAFELTSSEQMIRDHPSSCFVLGRSGTGKTTTMVFKMVSREMLNIQQSAEAAETDAPPPSKYRQLFITQSRILARRVQDYFGKMLMSQSVGQKTSQEIERLAQRNLRASEGDDLFDSDDEDEDERSDLPKKFSELKDHDFPLFLNVDQLCKLLEADCDLSFKRRPRTKEHRRAEQRFQSVDIGDEMVVLDDDDLAKDDDITNTSPSTDSLGGKTSIINFDTFHYTYWPHFPQPLTKGLDPALVWNEFMGVIKGSEESLNTADGSNHLDKVTYLDLSHRRQSTFANKRERIYCLFECYAKLKRARGDYDVADRAHAILKALNEDVPGRRKVDFLYVDEVQDNLLVDALLLRQLCGNPHGLFWAGDTAQTISMGSSFRFDDLKAFLFRVEEKSCGLLAPVRSESFQLAINYRSHAGVVNCAHSIVWLMTKFWPHTLDSLATERGLVDGPRPVFFCGWDPKVTRYEQFLFHEAGNIEFGAQQCILVRNEKARDDLRREIGDVGLIMTLYESKGLEFNDVLLFNFFADSKATFAEWRVLLNAVDESKRGNVAVPQFDETRHASICSELKSLYVGITRARCHVWILDIPGNDEERGEPMRIFWESRGLVQTCRPGDEVPDLTVRSTPEQWAQQGRALFKTRHFQLAIFCFERAGLLLERSISHAYLLRRIAQRIHSGQEMLKKSYLQAAEAFVICAGISSISNRQRFLGIGADCFVAAEAYAAAAQAYLGAENFTKAAQQFKNARLFEEAADVVLLHPMKVNHIVKEQCISAARLHLHREHQTKSAARLFKSIDEQLLYLEDYGFDIARITVLQDLERWSDAAEIHHTEGRHLDAVSCWILADDAGSRERARIGLIESLWIALPLGKEPQLGDKQHIRLLELLRDLSVELVDQKHRDESTMFLAILGNDHLKLLRLAREFHGTKKNPMAALLCFDHALKKLPEMQNDSGLSVAKHLRDYDSYAQLMRKLVLDILKFQGEEWVQVAKLLGIAEIQGATTGAPTELHVLPTSILYEPLKNENTFTRLTNESIPITLHSLSIVTRRVLARRLRERLREENDVCLYSKSFRPCLKFAVDDFCGRPECPREHLHRESSVVEAFNLRVRLHMQQILIINNMTISLDNGDGRRWQQRIWRERLYETLFPPFHVFGHISVLSKHRHNASMPGAISTPGRWTSTIPEHERASRILSVWLYDRFYELRPDDKEAKFMTDAVQTAMLSFVIDRHNAEHYLWRAPCAIHKFQYPQLQREGGYIMHDLLDFLGRSSKSSVTSGVMFIKHVLDQQIPIDVYTLLNVLDAVVGLMIMTFRPSLHHLTLPRSWIVNLLSNWDERCRPPAPLFFRQLFGPLAKLQRDIYSKQGVGQGVDHLMYEGRPLATLRIDSTARTVMIFRICRSLAFLGYNIDDQSLRDEIGKTVTSLSNLGRNFPSLISPYVQAKKWPDISFAVRQGVESPLDELIHLGEADKLPAIYHKPKDVKLLRFKSVSDVLPALEYVTANFLNPEAKAFVPATFSQRNAAHTDAALVEDDQEPEEPFKDEGRVVEAMAPKDLSMERTEKEIEAAKKIQVWYRRKMSLATSETTRERSRLHADFAVQAKTLQVSPSYRRMFLGPLPHILVALHGCGKAIRNTKKIFKKLLASSDETLDYDEVNESITRCNVLFKQLQSFEKILEPASPFHLGNSVDAFKKHVAEVVVVMKDILALAPSAGVFMWDMEMGYKGIVQIPLAPPPATRSIKRPSLNTEDI